MTNNAGKRIDAKLSIITKIIIPHCPKQLSLDGGGSVSTKALDIKTLRKIAKMWESEFIKKARE